MELSEHARSVFRVTCAEADEEPLANLIDRVAAELGPGPHLDFNMFLRVVENTADKTNVKLTAKRVNLLKSALGQRDEQAAPVIKKAYKPGKEEADALYGRFETSVDGKGSVVEYQPDSDLRDTEQVPLEEPGGVDAFRAARGAPAYS